MAEPKTKKSNASVRGFLSTIKDKERKKDCLEVLGLMKEITGESPKMWGTSIVGFGSYHYVYASGREGDWMITGFSPRAKSLTLYLMSGLDRHEAILKKLGKYKTGKSCLYLSRLDEVDRSALKSLIMASVQFMKKKYPSNR